MKRLVFLLLSFLVPLLGATTARAQAARSQESLSQEPESAEHAPFVMMVGIDLDSIFKFEIQTGSFNCEFIVTQTCVDAAQCKSNLDVKNGKVLGKPELLHEGVVESGPFAGRYQKKTKIKAEVDGSIDLSEYPFDRHALEIVLEAAIDPDHVHYEIDREHTKVGNRLRLAGWVIGEALHEVVRDFDAGDGERIQYVTLSVEIARPNVSAFVKSLIPVLILLFIAGFQLLLRPKGASRRLMGSTATLSAAVMFHVGQIVGLPPVGYLTRLDKFMIATYLVLLVHIGLNVAIVRADEAKNESRGMKLYLISQGLVPGLAIGLWMLVFAKLV